MSDWRDLCPFCDVFDRPVLCRNDHALAIRDAYPVSDGHSLVIPRRHVLDVFALSDEELLCVFALVRDVKTILTSDFSPTGFNVGVNIGRDAGQTVIHAHVHIIPRYAGDVDDPTGGVRNVIRGKGHY
jgi:diadenosine tetraphosphate (Ap4A) HIT family hydrolase